MSCRPILRTIYFTFTFRRLSTGSYMYPYKFYAKLAGAAALAMASAVVSAQDVIKIGELNSYKTQPAFLGPYKKGMELAIEQIKAAGENGKASWRERGCQDV